MSNDCNCACACPCECNLCDILRCINQLDFDDYEGADRDLVVGLYTVANLYMRYLREHHEQLPKEVSYER